MYLTKTYPSEIGSIEVKRGLIRLLSFVRLILGLSKNNNNKNNTPLDLLGFGLNTFLYLKPSYWYSFYRSSYLYFSLPFSPILLLPIWVETFIILDSILVSLIFFRIPSFTSFSVFFLVTLIHQIFLLVYRYS